MAFNRKAAEALILEVIAKISNHPENVGFYKDKFSKMKDAEAVQFYRDLIDGKIALSIVEPNMTDRPNVDRRKIVDVAKELGVEFEQRLWIEGKAGLPAYLTPIKFPVYLVPVRRASQSLTKKISVPPHTRVRDLLTGQVTGESKGASVSGPENQLMGAMGAEQAAIEMGKFRGGDARGEAAFVALLSKTGRASQKVLDQFSSGVQVTAALRTFLTAAMHRVRL